MEIGVISELPPFLSMNPDKAETGADLANGQQSSCPRPHGGRTQPLTTVPSMEGGKGKKSTFLLLPFAPAPWWGLGN